MSEANARGNVSMAQPKTSLKSEARGGSLMRIIIKSVLVLIILFTCLFISKDYFLKQYITAFISRQFNGDVNIQAVHLSPSQLKLTGISFSNENLKLESSNLILDFYLAAFKIIKLKKITSINSSLKINDFEKIKNIFAIKSTKNGKLGATYFSVDKKLIVNVDNFFIEIAKINNIKFTTRIVLNAIVENENKLDYKKIEISDFNISSNNLNINNLSLRLASDGICNLAIPSLKIKNKEIKNIKLPLRIKDKMIELLLAPNIFFGDKAFWQGMISIIPPADLFLQMQLQNASWVNFIEIFDDKNEVTLEGLHNGLFTLSLRANHLNEINGYFENNSGGFINIKKETSLDFLRNYLDKASYKLLIDSLKNYKYNKGKIMLGKVDNAISLDMRFESDIGGERKLGINLHGGVK